jgi:hypothetical protein
LGSGDISSSVKGTGFRVLGPGSRVYGKGFRINVVVVVVDVNVVLCDGIVFAVSTCVILTSVRAAITYYASRLADVTSAFALTFVADAAATAAE